MIWDTTIFGILLCLGKNEGHDLCCGHGYGFNGGFIGMGLCGEDEKVGSDDI